MPPRALRSPSESLPSGYTMFPAFRGIPERIAGLLPDVRLIYLLRHPIERLQSHYLMTHYMGDTPSQWGNDPVHRERRSIEKALLKNPHYMDCSRYAMQVQQYLECFSPEQLLIIRSEELRNDRVAVMRRVYEFLGVDASWPVPIAEQEYNRTADRRFVRPFARSLAKIPGLATLTRGLPLPLRERFVRRLTTHRIDLGRGRISADLRRQLEDTLRDDVEQLRGYVGDGFDGWGIV